MEKNMMKNIIISSQSGNSQSGNTLGAIRRYVPRLTYHNGGCNPYPTEATGKAYLNTTYFFKNLRVLSTFRKLTVYILTKLQDSNNCIANKDIYDADKGLLISFYSLSPQQTTVSGQGGHQRLYRRSGDPQMCLGTTQNM